MPLQSIAGFFVAILILFWSPSSGYASDVSQCLSMMESKAYKQAYLLCYRAASDGDARAQYSLGLIFSNGYGLEANTNKARVWLSKAAESGYTPARQKLASLVDIQAATDSDPTDDAKQPKLRFSSTLDSNSVNKKTVKPIRNNGLNRQNKYGVTIKSTRKKNSIVKSHSAADEAREAEQRRLDSELLQQTLISAQVGDKHAQLIVGLMYLEGRGSERDSAKALKYTELAANQDYPEAQFTLGLMYYQGLCTNKDDKTAIHWLVKAASKGLSKAQYSLGLIYTDRYSPMKNATEAVHWWKKAAKQGHHHAQFNLGVMYLKGHGVKQNKELAQKWLEMGALHGSADGCYELALLISEGQWLKKSKRNAVNWFYRAGEKYLEAGDIESAKNSAQKIKSLSSQIRMKTTNVFLGDVLDKQIRQQEELSQHLNQ